jgi:hypothetical protein
LAAAAMLFLVLRGAMAAVQMTNESAEWIWSPPNPSG